MVYALAANLHKTAGEVMAMPAQEFTRWIAHFALREEDNDPQAQQLKAMGFQLE